MPSLCNFALGLGYGDMMGLGQHDMTKQSET